MPDMWNARGHIAKILVFDEKTILLPLNESEASRLLNMVRKTHQLLKATGDFPEEQQYLDLLDNLHSALWLLTDKPKRK